MIRCCFCVFFVHLIPPCTCMHTFIYYDVCVYDVHVLHEQEIYMTNEIKTYTVLLHEGDIEKLKNVTGKTTVKAALSYAVEKLLETKP